MMKNLFFCVTCLLGIIISPVLAASLKCYKGTINSYLFSTSLATPLALLNTSCIDSSLPTVIYTFGYGSQITALSTKTVLSAYVGTGKHNVLLLDWQKEATPIGYTFYAVPNAIRIGKQLGDSLVKLAISGFNMSDIHLVGHSLGAHLLGYAGRRATQNGFIVPRITGLDPARNLGDIVPVQNGLDATCAQFVDIIHTYPEKTTKPSGTVDLWPNYSGGDSVQPGCQNGLLQPSSQEDNCSHSRAWQFFAESISAPTSFIAVGAKNYDDWLEGNYDDNSNFTTIYMGDLIDVTAKGNFYLTTNAVSPFGRGIEGIKPEN